MLSREEAEMKFRRITWLVVIGAVLALPIAAYAQEATLSGTVTDATGVCCPE